jgi:hypothetical protein
MKPQDLLPKRVVNYIQDIGVRTLDHLAARIDSPPPPVAPEGEPPPASPANATQTLVDHWKAMSPAEKEQFVGRVSSSVMEVIVASATLPPALKKTVKEAKKVIRKRVKEVRKAAAKKKKESPKKKSPKKNSGARPKKKKKT